MPLILGANSVTGGYEVDNSLRFENTSTDGLTRTITSSGNRQTWTWSGWVKRSKLTATTGDSQILFNTGENTGGILDYNTLRFNTDDTFLIAGVSNNGATTNYAITTNAVYRDVSAWYHVVVAFDSTQGTSSDRIKLYINGVQVTSFSSATYPTLNYDSFVNFLTRPYYGIGDRINSSGQLFAGYMSEIVFIDGLQLTPTDFGEFDEDTGIWKPIDVSGLTFGTNGFYLDFENSGSLGADVSVNGNNFTVNNLTSIDQTTDTCTNNFSTMNPLIPKYDTPITFSNGNLQVASSGGSTFDGKIFSTLGVTQGKWYAEFKPTAFSTNYHGYGIFATQGGFNETDANGLCRINYAWSSPSVYAFGSTVESGLATTSANDILAIALDIDNGTVQFYKNGSTYGNQVTGLSSDFANKTIFFVLLEEAGVGRTFTLQTNFGNPSFTISSGNTDANGYGNFEYSVPSGYYALNTKNLAEYG
jgi:hypothetical protein